MLKNELSNSFIAADRPPFRSRVEFAEQAIVIPEGKHEGSRWSRSFLPFAYHMLHLMDGTHLRRFAISGCVQSGKTLNAVVINTCWHLFERGESVIFLVPQLTMAEKKWTEEIEPVINKSPALRAAAYGDARRTSLPKGKGSKSGFNNTIRFVNGTRLEFMGSLGSDASRSGSTAPVVMKTEVDRSDTASSKSREASAALTTEDRTESYGDDAWIYEECTLTTTDGRIYKQIKAGTDHQLYYCCPQCGKAIRPRRQHFVGVEGCESIVEARQNGVFICPEQDCAFPIDNDTREAMLKNATPAARSQKVTYGSDGLALVEGDIPPVEVLSFTWNAFDNLFWTNSRIAAREWQTLYGEDLDEEDLQARQKRWTEPAVAQQLDVSKITNKDLIKSQVSFRRNLVPPGTLWITTGADYRETQIHFVTRAWTYEDNILIGHALDIGWLPVERDKYGAKDAAIKALRDLRDKRLFAGVYRSDDGTEHVPDWVLIDARYKPSWLWQFIVESRMDGYRTIIPILGFGQTDANNRGSYRQPEGVDPPGPNQRVLWVGDECHLRSSRKYKPVFVEAGVSDPPIYLSANVDEGKAYLRDGYTAPLGTNGSLTTFEPTTADEREVVEDYRKQVRSERETQIYVEGKGIRRKYLNESKRPNHLFDADNYCGFGVQLCGAPVSLRLSGQVREPVVVQETTHIEMPDGRPFMEVDPV